jgi:hypothetical protein
MFSVALSIPPGLAGGFPALRRDILPNGVRTFLPGDRKRPPERPNHPHRASKVMDQGRQYKMRPQKLQVIMLRFFFTSWVICGGSFMWQPPQEPPSMATMA